MRLHPDVSGDKLAAALSALGYAVTRQTGSHLRLAPAENGEHHLTIPRHASLRIGTLASILADVQAHHGLTRDELLTRLDI